MNSQFVNLSSQYVIDKSSNEWINLSKNKLEDTLSQLDFSSDENHRFIPMILNPLETKLVGMQNCIGYSP